MTVVDLDPTAEVRRHWRLVLAVAAISAALVGVGLWLRGPEYASTAVVRVVLTPGSDVGIAGQVGSTGNEQAGRVLATQLEVVRGDDVAGRAAEALGRSPVEVESAVVVAPGKGSDTLKITGMAASPEEAQRLANALADAYVVSSKTAGKEQLRNSAESMQAQLNALKAQRDLLDAGSASPAVQAERASIQVQYNSLLVQQQSLLSQAAAYQGNAFILTEAPLNDVPSSMSPIVGLVLGFGLGVLLGIAVTLLVAYRRGRHAGEGDLAAGADATLSEALASYHAIRPDEDPDASLAAVPDGNQGESRVAEEETDAGGQADGPQEQAEEAAQDGGDFGEDFADAEPRESAVDSADAESLARTVMQTRLVVTKDG